MARLKPNRRTFLTGGGALVITAVLPLKARATPYGGTFMPNAHVRVGQDGIVTVLVSKSELGQGTMTGLTTLVAEELDADWEQMRAEHAPADVSLYANAIFGIQGTGGSTATPASWIPLRQAGAAARAMLVEAAAQLWGVGTEDVTVVRGIVSAQGGRSAHFGELVNLARQLTPPAEPTLKSPDRFVHIGNSVARIDAPEKSTGRAQYTIDVYREGMLTVALLRPPVFGARLVSFDATDALALPGVRRIEQVPSGIAVYADDTWSAFRGRDAVVAEWDDTDAETRSTDEMATVWAEAARRGDGGVAEEAGDVDQALKDAATVIEADYHFPFLAHAAMEPLDGAIELRDGSAEAWLGSQWQTSDQNEIAAVLGLDAADVALNTMYVGGSFGRRTQQDNHVAAEVAHVAKAAGPGTYKVVWSREDDMRGGYYRPMVAHHMKGGLDADGTIVGWRHSVASQSILSGSPFEQFVVDGIDGSSIEGARALPYLLANMRLDVTNMESKVPVLWWRAVGHTHTAYVVETFLDELLGAAGEDPVAGRLALLKDDDPRFAGVLQRVAEMADWRGRDGGADIARGVALHKSFGGYVAIVADVSLTGGSPRVHKIFAAVDIGRVINPAIVETQVVGGIGFGLSAALFEELRLRPGGHVAASNYDSYRILRNHEMPDVEVATIDSDLDPTGIGEPSLPPAAPAVANAIRRMTGETPRRLPFAAA